MKSLLSSGSDTESCLAEGMTRNVDEWQVSQKVVKRGKMSGWGG